MMLLLLQPCTIADCLYLHDFGPEEDSFSKDDIVSAFTRYCLFSWCLGGIICILDKFVLLSLLVFK